MTDDVISYEPMPFCNVMGRGQRKGLKVRKKNRLEWMRAEIWKQKGGGVEEVGCWWIWQLLKNEIVLKFSIICICMTGTIFRFFWRNNSETVLRKKCISKIISNSVFCVVLFMFFMLYSVLCRHVNKLCFFKTWIP